jgi:hypothetical protein
MNCWRKLERGYLDDPRFRITEDDAVRHRWASYSPVGDMEKLNDV